MYWKEHNCSMCYSIKFAVCVAILVCVGIIKTIAIKRKISVEFSQQNSRWNKTVINTIHGVRNSDFLVWCVHNPICGAYNWISKSGTCELLPVFRQCEKEAQEDENLCISQNVERMCHGLHPCETGVQIQCV